MLTLLTKEQTEALEENSTSMMNIIEVGVINTGSILEFHDWYTSDTRLINLNLYKRVDFISKCIGIKPSYYKTHSRRNAVWGFIFEGNEYVLYYSTRGLSLQAAKNVTSDEMITLVKFFATRWDNVDE